jgi:hypothetical protein
MAEKKFDKKPPEAKPVANLGTEVIILIVVAVIGPVFLPHGFLRQGAHNACIRRFSEPHVAQALALILMRKSSSCLSAPTGLRPKAQGWFESPNPHGRTHHEAA